MHRELPGDCEARSAPQRDCIEIVDLSARRLIASVEIKSSPNGCSIAWSPDGKVIATVENDGFRFYYSSSLNAIAFVGFRYASHVEFSSNGKFVALGAWSGGEVRPIESVLSGGDGGSYKRAANRCQISSECLIYREDFGGK